MTGKGGDYEGWMLRLIEKPEDILKSLSEVEWLKFAADKIEEATGQGITKEQINTLLEYRDGIFELPQELGFKIEEKTRYRDAKGRWTSDTTATPISRIIYRDEGFRFMARNDVADIIQAEQTARGISKTRFKKE